MCPFSFEFLSCFEPYFVKVAVWIGKLNSSYAVPRLLTKNKMRSNDITGYDLTAVFALCLAVLALARFIY